MRGRRRVPGQSRATARAGPDSRRPDGYQCGPAGADGWAAYTERYVAGQTIGVRFTEERRSSSARTDPARAGGHDVYQSLAARADAPRRRSLLGAPVGGLDLVGHVGATTVTLGLKREGWRFGIRPSTSGSVDRLPALSLRAARCAAVPKTAARSSLRRKTQGALGWTRKAI